MQRAPEACCAVQLCRFIDFIRNILQGGEENNHVQPAVLPNVRHTDRQHGPFHVTEPVLLPALQPEERQHAVQHPVFGVINHAPN
ncbi:hypothetical protein D3C81_2143300 [compost metagenome]